MMRIWFTSSSCVLGVLSSPVFNGGHIDRDFVLSAGVLALLAIAWRPQ